MIRFTHWEVAPQGGWLPSAVTTVVEVTAPYGARVPVPWLRMMQIPAERATWDAERTRLAGPSDPEAWSVAASRWRDLGCPHRAGYAWWRQAQAQLEAGQPPTAAAPALRAALAAADGHVPLQAQVRALAGRARITLQTPAATAPPLAEAPTAFGLTSRELAVLRLGMRPDHQRGGAANRSRSAALGPFAGR